VVTNRNIHGIESTFIFILSAFISLISKIIIIIIIIIIKIIIVIIIIIIITFIMSKFHKMLKCA